MNISFWTPDSFVLIIVFCACVCVLEDVCHLKLKQLVYGFDIS